MKKIIIKNIVGFITTGTSKIGEIHALHPINSNTLCNDLLSKYHYYNTDELVSCKNCLRIIEYCRGENE